MGKDIVVDVVCCGTTHKIFQRRDGSITFMHHRGVSVRALASEFGLLEPTNGANSVPACFQVAAFLYTGHTPHAPGIAGIPAWYWRLLESITQKRNRRRMAQAELLLPWDAVPFHERIKQYTHPLYVKAARLLDTARFRTSKVSHRTELLLGERTFVIGTNESLPGSETKKGKKTFANKRQVVKVTLDMKQWGRVALFNAGHADGNFVLRITKVWSDNDLTANVLKQSTGYRVKVHPARIRRGSDGTWRVVEWMNHSAGK